MNNVNSSQSIINDPVFQKVLLGGISLSQYERYLNLEENPVFTVTTWVKRFFINLPSNESLLNHFITGLEERVKNSQLIRREDLGTQFKVNTQIIRICHGLKRNLRHTESLAVKMKIEDASNLTNEYLEFEAI